MLNFRYRVLEIEFTALVNECNRHEELRERKISRLIQSSTWLEFKGNDKAGMKDEVEKKQEPVCEKYILYVFVESKY